MVSLDPFLKKPIKGSVIKRLITTSTEEYY